MSIKLAQTVTEVPSRHGSVIIGLGFYWDFGKRVLDDSGKKKIYGSVNIDFLIWTLAIGIRERL